MKLRWVIIMSCTLALAACEKLADEESSGAAVATMRGTLNLAEGMDPPKGDLHLSILWRTGGRGDLETVSDCGPDELTSYRDQTQLLEQRLELDTDFPAAFSVELSEPPPESALFPVLPGEGGTPGVKRAEGELIVYRDGNHNGRLDLHGFDESSPDQVLGAGEGTAPGEPRPYTYRIQYLTDDLAVVNQTFPASKAGYWLLREGRDKKTHEWTADVLALDGKAKIELILDATKYVQRWACSEVCDVRDPDACPEDPADLPPVQDIGEPQEGETASWFWSGEKGDRTEMILAECVRGAAADSPTSIHEVYEVSLTTQEGCTTTRTTCFYVRGRLPAGVDIPCTEFMQGLYPNGFKFE